MPTPRAILAWLGLFTCYKDSTGGSAWTFKRNGGSAIASVVKRESLRGNLLDGLFCAFRCPLALMFRSAWTILVPFRPLPVVTHTFCSSRTVLGGEQTCSP